MAVPLEKFIEQLEASGILAGDTLKDFLPPKASPKDGEELARELVRKKKLTKFQAEEVYRGKAKSLVLGNYVLMEKIGAGGMGQVFKARHRRMDRLVAVKLLPAAMSKDTAAIARFEREVKAAAKLNHPNIVAALDADCANGVHFLVMELVEGNDLSALVKKNGPFSLDQAINLVLQAAKGLEAAHAEGIVHRDIKPANLLLDKKGTVKILDMGLARLSLDGDEAPQADLTSTGTIMGTVDYMSPEQAMDTKSADARADIYALGCSLFFLLTGKATYDGDTLMKKLVAHREAPIPSLRAAKPDIPEQVETIFKKMIAKKVEDRYQTASEVVAALSQCDTKDVGDMQTFIMANSIGKASDPTAVFATPTKPVISDSSKTSVSGWNRKGLAMVGGGVLGAVVLLAGLVINLQTKAGTLVVEVDQPDAVVQVLNAEGKVEISKPGVKGAISISVDPGKHRIKVEKDGFAVFGQDFELKSGDKTEIKTKLVPVSDKSAVAAAVAGTKPWESPEFKKWIQDVQAMPAEKQIEAVSKKLVELNPGFDGKVTLKKLENEVGVDLRIQSDKITDISPLRGLSGVKYLNLDLCLNLSDLSPLQGMELMLLSLVQTKVADLTPLVGMELRNLAIQRTLVRDLSPVKDMPLWQLQIDATPITDLGPLRGKALGVLGFDSTAVSDLSALRGMSFNHLHFGGTQVTDLSPLKGMSIRNLQCSDFMPERDAELLRSIKNLEVINGKLVAEFWKEVEEQQKGKKLGFQMPGFDQWVKEVQAMPAEEQVNAVSKKLVELNPGFDGKVTGWDGDGTPKIENGVVMELRFASDHVTDISPVRALGELRALVVRPSQKEQKSKLSDISSLRGLRLTAFDCAYTPVSDLSPLQGMRLREINCGRTQVSDLSPLKGMPLTRIECPNTRVNNLLPLQKMSLTKLNCSFTLVSDLTPLEGMPLNDLQIFQTNITDLSPLRGMPLEYLEITHSKVSDLLPLNGLKMKSIAFSPRDITTGIDGIRQMTSLKTIAVGRGGPKDEFAPDDFWLKYDAGEFGKPITTDRQNQLWNTPAFQAWVKEVQTMPAEEQLKAVSKKLMELNPGFDGKVTGADEKGSPKIENGVVNEVGFFTDNVTDMSPVRVLTGLKWINCSGSKGRVKFSDLSPLEGLPLTKVNCGSTEVSDLSPLKGMPLREVLCGNTYVSDLTPLINCNSLKYIYLRSTKATPAGVAALQNALPNCKIEWDDPDKAKTPPTGLDGK